MTKLFHNNLILVRINLLSRFFTGFKKEAIFGCSFEFFFHFSFHLFLFWFTAVWCFFTHSSINQHFVIFSIISKTKVHPTRPLTSAADPVGSLMVVHATQTLGSLSSSCSSLVITCIHRVDRCRLKLVRAKGYRLLVDLSDAGTGPVKPKTRHQSDKGMHFWNRRYASHPSPQNTDPDNTCQGRSGEPFQSSGLDEDNTPLFFGPRAR